MGGLAGLEQISLRRVAQRHVDVFAVAVHTRERFFVEQAGETVLARDLLQHGHDDLLVVGGDVGVFKHRRELELGRGHLVVARLDGHAELKEFALDRVHAGLDAFVDGPEVVVVQLLALGGRRAEQGAARVEQVGTRQVKVAVDQKILLLRARRRRDQGYILVTEQLEDPFGLLV